MADVAHTLVRRVISASQQPPSIHEMEGEHPIKSIAFIGLALIWVTVIIYMAAISAVRFIPSVQPGNPV